jgi:hypothetical protein
MAQFNQSAFGEIKGKVGNMVVTPWKDKHVAKSKPGKSNKPATTAQKEQRKKMQLTGKFMRNLKDVVSLCYRDRSGSVPGFSAAMGDVLVNGITGTYPDYSIDYSQVQLSRGDIRQPFKPTVASTKIDTLTFTWTTISGMGKSRPDDKAILVAYCEKLDVSAYIIEGPPRSSGTGELQLPGFGGEEVHTWVAFISANGKDVCNSMYAGKVTIAAS